MDIFLAAMALIFFLPITVVIAIAMWVQEKGPAFAKATRDDPRVNAIGKLLRSTRIDQLPQLLNVWNGDMSLIGPLSHALAHDSYFENSTEDQTDA